MKKNYEKIFDDILDIRLHARVMNNSAVISDTQIAWENAKKNYFKSLDTKIRISEADKEVFKRVIRHGGTNEEKRSDYV